MIFLYQVLKLDVVYCSWADIDMKALEPIKIEWILFQKDRHILKEISLFVLVLPFIHIEL